MADIRNKYNGANADTVALTITLASLASSTTRLGGRESSAVNNRTDNDIDHLLSGKIRVGTSPTASRLIEVWVAAPIDISSGTATWPDVLDGTDSDETLTSENVKNSALRLAWSTLTDATSDRDYFIPPTSIASLFGELPPLWVVFVTHDTGVALNSTGGNHFLDYHRVQKQSV
jgi:hypothetical protein